MAIILWLVAIVWGVSFCTLAAAGVLCGFSAGVRHMIWGDQAIEAEHPTRPPEPLPTS